MANWNPWHGCHKISAGCERCYVYRMDKRHGKETGFVTRLKDFDKVLHKNRKGEYKIASDEIVYTCFTSDFLVEEADVWRDEVWNITRQRRDLFFFMITKRIDRLVKCIPYDWGAGQDHVGIACTVETMEHATYRLPIYQAAPLRHKYVVCEPLPEPLNLRPWLDDNIEELIAGGEGGPQARVCQYEWILGLRKQCEKKGISSWFKQIGANFVKDNIRYHVPRRQQYSQARKMGINLNLEIILQC